MARDTIKKLPLDKVRELEEEYYELVPFNDDDARARMREIALTLRRCGRHVRCGDEPLLTIDVPLGPDRDDSGNRRPLRINGKAIQGKITVPQCEAREILRLIDHAWRVDAQRMNDNGFTYRFDLSREGTLVASPENAIAERARRIQAEA